MSNLVTKKGKYSKSSGSYGRTLFTLIIVVALVAVLLINFFTMVCSIVQYYGDSMEPSFSDRQILIVHKTDKVSSGDVVAFYYNNKVLVRRIIAEGGTSLTIDETGIVILDGNVLPEDYVEESALGQCNISFPYTVPYKEYFVMGDNRLISMDSRLAEIGTVPQDRILGKVIYKFG